MGEEEEVGAAAAKSKACKINWLLVGACVCVAITFVIILILI